MIPRLRPIQRHLARRSLTSWAAAVRDWDASHINRDPHPTFSFGEHSFWESRYKSGRAPKDWFLDAQTAAESTVDAFMALSAARWQRSAPVRILHLGCGTSNLGGAVCDALDVQGCEAHVTNVDYSASAIEEMTRVMSDARQCWVEWDVAAAPPSTSQGMDDREIPSSWDLLLDKGTLDAVAFCSTDKLVGYLTSIRHCLRSHSCNQPGSSPPLFVHFSDEPPELRRQLLAAAFPEWSISVTTVEVDSLDNVHTASSFEYFRYVVYMPIGASKPAHRD